MSFLRIIAILVAVAALGAGVIGAYLWQGGASPREVQPMLVLASPAPQPDFSALLVADSGGKRQVLSCTKQRCTPQLLPQAINGHTVFDGEGWLYYTEAESVLTSLTKRILVRSLKATGATTQLIEQTPLTSPRELMVSPTGEHTAFFLDNIDRPADELTELWVYDRAKNGVRLLAEKLYQPDIRSRIRWNRAGTLVWFLADNGAQGVKSDVLELVAAPLTARPAVVFKKISWDKLADVVDHGMMDISPSGSTVAFATPRLFGRNEIVVMTEGQGRSSFSVRGAVVYLQILEDNSVVYAVQDARGVTFWRLRDNVQRHIARQPGRMLAAHGVPTGEFVVLVTQADGTSVAQLQLLHTPTGTFTQSVVAGAFGTVHVAQLLISPTPQQGVAGATTAFDDAEIVAFIDQHFPAIVAAPGAKAQRLVVTNAANTVFVDYATRAGHEERILLAIHDLSRADWAIKARYTIQQAEWRKVVGGGLPDPKPIRLYEWEESVGQWILKSSNL